VRSSAAIILSLSIALTAAFLLSGCGGGGGATFSVFGTVVDNGTLAPIYNASVHAGGSTTTDLAGDFIIDGASGNTLRVTATGYRTQEVPIPGSSGTVDMSTVYMEPVQLSNTGNVTGTVTRGGTAVGGSAITVNVAGLHAMTRADGTYTLYNVPQGSRTIYAVAPDAQTGGSRSINVFVAPQINTADILLTLQPPGFPPIF
jgi:hypothetical protein